MRVLYFKVGEVGTEVGVIEGEVEALALEAEVEFNMEVFETEDEAVEEEAEEDDGVRGVEGGNVTVREGV